VIIDSDKVLIESQFVARYLGEQVIWNGEDNVVIQSADYKTKISLDGKRNIVILGNGIIAIYISLVKQTHFLACWIVLTACWKIIILMKHFQYTKKCCMRFPRTKIPIYI